MRASLTDADKDAGATHEAGSWCWRISRAGDPDVETNNYPDNQADDAREIDIISPQNPTDLLACSQPRRLKIHAASNPRKIGPRTIATVAAKPATSP